MVRRHRSPLKCILLLAAGLLLARADTLAAQGVTRSLAEAPAVRILAPAAAPQFPSGSKPSGVSALRSAADVRVPAGALQLGGMQPSWRRPLIGAVIGGAIGAAAATVVMHRADEWLAPPAHFFLVPGGMVVGAGLGLLWRDLPPD